jgi:hypothetical protein
MTEHTSGASKTLTRAVPTVDENGNVLHWDLAVVYALDGYQSTFESAEVAAASKAPDEFTKAELLTEMAARWDHVFESQYVSTQMPTAEKNVTLADFDVASLA